MLDGVRRERGWGWRGERPIVNEGVEQRERACCLNHRDGARDDAGIVPAVHDEVCGYVTSGRLPLREFVTHKIPVEDFAEGLRLVRGREGIKIALTF